MLQYFSLLKRKSKDGRFGKPSIRKRRARGQRDLPVEKPDAKAYDFGGFQ